MENITTNINFNKLPYSGVFSTVAMKLRISRQAVQKGWNNNSPDIVNLVNKEIIRRKDIIKQKEELEHESILAS